MNKHLTLTSITGMVVLTLAGCATTTNENGANNNSVTTSTITTSGAKASNSSGSTNNTSSNTTGNSGNKVQVSSSSSTTSKSDYASEIALIKNKGYSVSGSTPNVTVQTASGDTLAAWITAATQLQDGHN